MAPRSLLATRPTLASSPIVIPGLDPGTQRDVRRLLGWRATSADSGLRVTLGGRVKPGHDGREGELSPPGPSPSYLVHLTRRTGAAVAGARVRQPGPGVSHSLAGAWTNAVTDEYGALHEDRKPGVPRRMRRITNSSGTQASRGPVHPFGRADQEINRQAAGRGGGLACLSRANALYAARARIVGRNSHTKHGPETFLRSNRWADARPASWRLNR